MRGPRRFLLLIVLAVTLAACTKTVRVVEPLDYSVPLTDTTRMFEIHTRDGAIFVSKKAQVQSDTLLVVTRGYQVQTDPWRQKKLASAPIHIPVSNISQISQIDIDQDRSLAVVLVTLAVVVGVGFLIGIGAGLGGP